MPNELPAQSVPALPGARARRLRAMVCAAVFLAPAAVVAGSVPAPVRSGHAVRRGLSRPLTEIARRSSASTAKAGPRASRRAASPGTPALFFQFDGLAFNDNLPFYEDVFPPPDPSGSVGPSHYVQAINLVLEVFDLDGNSLLGPLPTATLWAGLGGVCATEALASPQVRYDQLADRWVVAQSAYDSSDASVHECFAVSQTPDPTGSYYAYDFPLGPTAQAGSARLAMWPDGYYVPVNQVQGFSPAGIGIYAFDRSAMLAGGDAVSVYADAGADHPQTLWGLAADFEGFNPPAADTPGGSATPANVIAAIGHPVVDGSPTPTVHLWYFHPDFATPPNSTLTGPVDIEQYDFVVLDCGTPSQGCVPQLNSNQLLQASPNRLMSRMPYRNFGDHDEVVATFTVGTDGGQAAPRWFELRDPLGTPVMVQQGTHAPDDSNRFVPSIGLTITGVIVLAYNKSDATIHPSLGWTFHLPGDADGTMQAEDVFFEGPNSQPPVVGFWGSASSLSLDPSLQCELWFTAEYTGDPSPLFERTRVAVLNPFCGDSFGGTLEGTVTDSSSGVPIPNAHVHISLGADTTTDSAGHYRFLNMPAGNLDVTVSKYAYIPATATGVVIQAGQTTTQDFALAPAPQALLNGTVKDGSGGGWPLYARVTVSGPGFGSTQLYTDPVTGYYGITLVAGVSYTLSTEAILPGYLTDQRDVLLQASGPSLPDGVQHIALTADSGACNAPGYALVANGLSEHFDSGGVPPGWQVVNDGGGAGWTIQSTGDPCGLFPGNDTGGSGAYALVNSHCEGETLEDTQLITPAVDASALSSLQIRFAQELNGPFPPAGESAEVDVSTDGGANWTNVLHQSQSALGPNTQSIDVTAIAAGQSDVRARFHYFNAFAAWWWQVDDVIVGETSCAARPGGLVVGNVFDANTGEGLNGASVARAPDPPATTFATPFDPAQPDGLYVLFSPSAGQTIAASQPLYAPESKPVTVVPNAAQRLDFHLAAGRLDASPRPLSVRVNPGEVVTRTLDMTNTGSYDAGFALDELNAPAAVSDAVVGPFADEASRAAALARFPAGRRDAPTARGLAPLSARSVRPLAAGNVVNAFPANLAAPWGLAFDVDAGDFWVSNSAPFVGDGRDYRFTTDGTQTGDTIDDGSWIAEFAADGAYDPRTKTLWRVNVGGDDCVYELDPAAKAPTGRAICPAFGTSQRGLAYDVVSDTWYSGSWNDGVIQRFDAAGNILASFYVGVAISGLAFDPTSGRLYALTNHDALLGFDVYVFDTHAGMAAVGAFNVTSAGAPALSPNGGAGMDFACDGHLWLVDSVSQTIYEVETDQTNVCAFQDIPWLSEDPAEGTVAAGATLPVTCTFDSTGLSAGQRLAQLLVATDTPYPVALVPVQFTVRFADVTDGSPFDPYIYAAAGAGIMPGCDPAAFLFCPTAQVTRADMAAYILRAVHGAGFVPTPYAGAFADVHAGDYNADWIQSFYDEGYTVGCGGGNFCPDAVHTRAQTSVFIVKGVNGTSFVPPPCTGVFNDVPCSSSFAPWIEYLYNQGITAGCGGGNFCPSAGIPNQQMATFLVRAFEIPTP